MNQLLIDMGNTRVKWAVRRSGRLGRMQALTFSGDGSTQLRQLAAAGARAKVGAVIAVSVAGASRERVLRRCIKAAGLPAPRWTTSQAVAAGVRNGYRAIWKLGADRWVAAVGAWHEAGRGCAVAAIDIGTATTLDVVEPTGRHRGGLIIPGPALMVGSLLRGTRGIARRAEGSRASKIRQLATDTAMALQWGALQATAAFVARSAAHLRETHGESARVFVTGGGAAAVRPLLPADCELIPDLVLRGLAVLADEAP
jgi:type III pantothenate kinase